LQAIRAPRGNAVMSKALV